MFNSIFDELNEFKYFKKKQQHQKIPNSKKVLHTQLLI